MNYFFQKFLIDWRRHPGSNRGMTVLQTVALPLGYTAVTLSLNLMAERERFELSLGSKPYYRISNPAPSATWVPLREHQAVRNNCEISKEQMPHDINRFARKNQLP